MELLQDEIPDLVALLRYDAYPALDALVEDEMIQHDAVQVGTQNAQHHGFAVIEEGGGKSDAHAGGGHGLSQLDVQIFVHDLRHDIQAAGGGVPVEQNRQAHADGEDIADHIQGHVPGEGGIIRQKLLEQPDEKGQKNRGIHGFCAELPAAGEKSHQEKGHIQRHRELGHAEGQHIGQKDGQTGDTADRAVARHQKEEHGCRYDEHSA